MKDNNIKLARLKAGFLFRCCRTSLPGRVSQRELAKRCGVGYSIIASIEMGNRAVGPKMARILLAEFNSPALGKRFRKGAIEQSKMTTSEYWEWRELEDELDTRH
jgi:transcriptional regulator with XRE-family HTH domain